MTDNRLAHGGDVWQGECHPDHWLDFSANLNPDGPPEAIVQAVFDAVAEMRWYPDIHMKSATNGIADFLRVPAAHILPTAGGLAALEIAAGVAHADSAIVAQPGFVEYERISRLRGLRIINVQTLQGRQFLPAVPALKSELRPNAIVWLGNPANPTGIACPRDEILSLLDAVERAGATMIVDEAFIDYVPDLTMRHDVGAHSSLLVTGSLTKILAVPGARLGYLCAHQDMIAAARRIQPPWSLNTFANAIARALPAVHGAIERAVRENAVHREQLCEKLTVMGIHVFPSCANFLLLDMGSAGWSGTELAGRLRARGILVRDCSAYVGLDSRYIRIAVRLPSDNDRLLEAIDGIMKPRLGGR